MTTASQFPSSSEYVKKEPALNISFDTPWPPLAMDARPPMAKQYKRERTTFNKDQVAYLEEIYMKTNYPDIFAREEAALKCNLPEPKICIWFKNRRAKERQMAVAAKRNNGNVYMDTGRIRTQSNLSYESVSNTSSQYSQSQDPYRLKQENVSPNKSNLNFSSYFRSLEQQRQQNHYDRTSPASLPSYGPGFPAPNIQTFPTVTAKPRHQPPLLSQYQYAYASMYARAQQYPQGHGYPGAQMAGSPMISYQPQPHQFSQAMTPTTQSPSVTDEFEPVLFDILKDAEKLIVVDSNNITPDEMKTTRSVL